MEDKKQAAPELSAEEKRKQAENDVENKIEKEIDADEEVHKSGANTIRKEDPPIYPLTMR